LNPYVTEFLEQIRAGSYQRTDDAAAATQMSWQALADLREQQAASLAYFHDFWLFAVLSMSLVPLILLMKRSVAEKGA
jgi:DHA2 family multidrug resistance protein